MIKILAAIFDEKAGLYSAAVTMDTNLVAKRQFSDACNNPETNMGAHPSDYTLMQVGQFDDQSGIITGLDKPSLIATGLSLLKPTD